VSPAVRRTASAAGVVRATTIIHAALSTPEIHVFWPRSRKSSPSGRALVVIARASLPASGSVSPRLNWTLPSATPGRIARRCSAVPCRTSVVAPNPGVRMKGNTAAEPAPEAASVSHATASSTMP
jgi:hypothetical protein